MSQAREDWKFFEQETDTMTIKDLTAPQSIEVRNVSKGTWAAFCIYDDDNRIERVLLAKADLMEKVTGNGSMRRSTGKYIGYEDVAFANAGIFCFFDKAHMNEYRRGYESKFQDEGIEKWGRPDDESKPDARKFIELACHLTKFRGLDLLDSADYGVFFRAHSHLDLGFMRDKKSGEVELIEAVAR